MAQAHQNSTIPLSVQRIVPAASDVNKRLDRFLNEQYPEKSRTQIQKMIQSGQVSIEGKLAKAGYRIRGTEQIELRRQEVELSAIIPEPIPINIVYEDNDL